MPDRPGWYWLSWSLPAEFLPGEMRDAVEVRPDGPEGLSILVDRDYETNVKEFIPVAKVGGRWGARLPSPAVCEAFQDWRDARAKARPAGECWSDADKLMYADDCDKAESALIDLLEALEAEGAE